MTTSGFVMITHTARDGRRLLVPTTCWCADVTTAARWLGLDKAEIEAAIENDGRCDTDRQILIPVEPA